MGEEVEDTEHPWRLQVYSLHGAREDAGTVRSIMSGPGEDATGSDDPSESFEGSLTPMVSIILERGLDVGHVVSWI